MKDFRALGALLRVKQWTKNIFVLAALVFTKSWSQAASLNSALLSVAAMCLVSSALYIVNDLIDLRADQRHPVKRNRPLARGAVSTGLASATAVFCAAAGLAIARVVGMPVLVGVLVYIGLQLAYNTVVKPVAVLDVFLIAFGFVMRVIIGALAIGVSLSGWILVCTFSLALLLGFGKRRHEFHLTGGGPSTRASLAAYSGQALDMFVLFSGASAAMTYVIYCIESPTAQANPGLVTTIPFVLYGICRYLLIVFKEGETGEPESLVLKDWHLIGSFALFVLFAVLAMDGRLPGLTLQAAGEPK